MNNLQTELQRVGLANTDSPRKRKSKQYKCRKCGSPMVAIEGTNVMSCTGDKCKNFYLFATV